LAAVLQVLPICRIGVVTPVATPSAWAIVMAWVAGAVALLGSYDVVSGASAGISGLVKYSGSTPVGLPTFDVAEPMGQAFRYRITVSNPGTDFDKNYFNCIPLPPGLTINTNPGGAGYISGIPTVAGTYTVTLVAGNLSFPTPATAQASIAIYLPNAPPVVTRQPQDQSVLPGSAVSFQAQVTGTPPLNYQWRRDGTNLPGASAAALSITNVQAVDAGDYQLFVSNAYGSATSAVARLSLREPLVSQVRLSGPVMSGGAIRFQVTGPPRTNFVIWRSSDLRGWTPVSTNWALDGLLQFSDPAGAASGPQLYRASLAP
jgi:hypothetical protein